MCIRDSADEEPGRDARVLGEGRGVTRTRCASAARIHNRPMHDTTTDRLAIRDLVESWAVWRDGGDWERFRTVWHDDGVMMATWFQGPADEFIRVTRKCRML